MVGSGDDVENAGRYDGEPWEMDQTMVPLPLRIRKKPGAITDSDAMATKTSTEEPSDGNYQLFQGYYWQSDSWRRFKDMGDSSEISSMVGSSLHIDVNDNDPALVGMDLRPLWRVRAGVFAGEESSKYVKAAGRGSSKTALGMLIDEVKSLQEVGFLAQDTTQRQPRRNPSSHMSWCIRFLSDIEEHQNTTDPADSVSWQTPHVLSNPLLASLWIREQMRDKWKEMYKVTLAPQRAEMRLRMRRAGNAADRRAVVAEKGHLMRQALKEVVADELSEIASALRQSLEPPAREIDNLYDLFLAQQQLLFRTHTSLPHLISIYDQQSSSLTHTLSQTIPSLLVQLDAIDSLLDIGLRTVSAMTTRINRVAAKDVRDAAEREREAKRRLENPGVALGYLGKAGDDLGFLRLWGMTVEAGFNDVEEELAGFAQRIVDLFVIVEASVLFIEG